MSEPKVRVLVIDDSAFARKVLREILSASGEIEFLGSARDGLDALERIAVLKPDVITLDLEMPELDGLGVLGALKLQPEPPNVVVVSLTDEDGELGVSALQAGAFDIVHKPTALALDRLYELGDDLLQKVIAAGRVGKRRSLPVAAPTIPPPPAPTVTHGTRIVVVGASTGGPQALTTLIGDLPRDFPVPMAVVIHMPIGYTEAFARRLDKGSAVEVLEAREGLFLHPGQVIVARAGHHLTIVPAATGWRVSLDLQPADAIHRPSVDVLFESAAARFGAGVLGVVLTGMGNDGLAGARAIHAVGGRLLTETEDSCVVYGMPRCVYQAGLAAAEGPAASMAAIIMSHL